MMSCGSCRQKQSKKNAKIEVNNKKAPITQADGSILYPDGLDIPEVIGYTQSEDDPQLLIPNEHTPCDWKLTGIMLQQDGRYKPMSVCRHQECEHVNQTVTSDICSECPFRSTS